MKIPEQLSAINSALLEGQDLTHKDFNNALAFMKPRDESFNQVYGKLNIMFYVDRFGDFMSNKTKTAKIVNLLYQSLDQKDQGEVLNYLMDNTED